MSERVHAGIGNTDGPGIEQKDSLIDLVKLADEHYRRRGEPAGPSSLLWLGQVDRLRAAKDSYELEWRVSRGLFLDGERSAELYARGVLHGRKAVALNGNRVEGHFWTGVNLALHAQASKGLKGALALIGARRALRRACEISEDYHGAGPLRVLGRLEHKSPKILGGSLARSQGHFKRALAIAPTNTVTLIYAAELEMELKDFARAVTLLETVSRLPIDPDWEFENIRDKTLAKSMLTRCVQRHR